MIQIDDSGNIYCALTPCRYHLCKPLELYASSAECSDCPIIKLGDEFATLKFDTEFYEQIIGRPLDKLTPPPADPLASLAEPPTE